MSIPALNRWIRRILRADRDALERMRTALEAMDADAADRKDGEACDRIAHAMNLADQRMARFATAHERFMDLGDRLHVDAPAVKVVHRPTRRLAPRRRGAGRPAGRPRVRRSGASSRTASCDPGDDPPASRSRRCAPGRRRPEAP